MNHLHLTIDELCDELRELDELDLLEMLDITSEELVDVFRKRIEKKRSLLEKKLSDIWKEDGDDFSAYQEIFTE
jgi:hypothetical protein